MEKKDESEEMCFYRSQTTKKSNYEGITLESAIPCESQAEKWTEEQRDRYFDIASKCDKETLIQHHYTPDCMHKRNRYMVDQADFIIAVWDGRPSGTGKTVQYAQRQGKPVTIINPKTMGLGIILCKFNSLRQEKSALQGKAE